MYILFYYSYTSLTFLNLSIIVKKTSLLAGRFNPFKVHTSSEKDFALMSPPARNKIIKIKYYLINIRVDIHCGSEANTMLVTKALPQDVAFLAFVPFILTQCSCRKIIPFNLFYKISLKLNCQNFFFFFFH